MDLALYHPELGYYATASQRSGRAGDFFTSVDVGSLFGRLLAIQIAEMFDLLSRSPSSSFDLVEAGAGNGRLAADVLDAMRNENPGAYQAVRLQLVEASAAARQRHVQTLGDSSTKLSASIETLPEAFEGVLYANELLDALPVHQVIMRTDGLREVYVEAAEGGLTTREGAPSTPAIEEYLARLGVTLEPGWRVEINLAAVDWIRHAARRLRRGFIILIDYGHPAEELYSVTHAGGTLTSFTRHTMSGPSDGTPTPAWLVDPGERDITAHVDFTTVRRTAEAEGMTTLGFLDQTYFLLGLCRDLLSETNLINAANHLDRPVNPIAPMNPLALKTLLMPGGLGSTMKVLILGKGVGMPSLRGCSYRMRVT